MTPLNFRFVFYILTILPFLCPAYCDEHLHTEGHEHRSTGMGYNDNSPLGVMGNHAHQADEIMFSYRYGIMEMNGNLDGSTSVSTQDILARYDTAPTSMRMEMHMIGAMYAVSDSITLMAMLPLKRVEMISEERPVENDEMAMGGMQNMPERRKALSSGAGDLKLSGVVPLWMAGDHSRTLKLNAGLSIPTGSIKETGGGMNMPGTMPMRMTYPMQMGSGTFDLLPGLTYIAEKNDWSWGAQANSVIRLGENGEDYSLGNRFQATAWYSRKLNNTLSASARIEGTSWGNIDGQDVAMDPMMSPTADADLRGGKRIDILFGLNLNFDETIDRLNKAFDETAKKSHETFNLAIEIGFPIHQDLDGPQMENDWRLITGLQLGF